MVNSLIVLDESRLELFFEKYFSINTRNPIIEHPEISFLNASILKLVITKGEGKFSLIYQGNNEINSNVKIPKYWQPNNNPCRQLFEYETFRKYEDFQKDHRNLGNAICLREKNIIKNDKINSKEKHSVYFLINTNPKSDGDDEEKAGIFFSSYLKGLTLDFAAVSDVKKSHDILTKFFEGVNPAITENTKIVVLPCNHPGKDGSGAFNNRDCDPNKCGTIRVNERVLPIDWTFYQSFYPDLRTTYIFSSRKGRKCRETDFLALFFEYYNNLPDIQKEEKGLQKEEEKEEKEEEEKEEKEEEKEEEGLQKEEEEKEKKEDEKEKKEDEISKVYTLDRLVEGGKKRARKVYYQKKTLKRKQKKTIKKKQKKTLKRKQKKTKRNIKTRKQII
jgi:hypothetical protein